MEIRRMAESDYSDFDSMMGMLHAMHVAERPDLYIPVEHIYTKEKFSAMVSPDSSIALMAFENGEALGFSIASIRERTLMRDLKSVYIEELYVNENARRKGVGSALFRETERIAREIGALRIDLMTWAFNSTALSFYSAMGLEEQRFILEKKLV